MKKEDVIQLWLDAEEENRKHTQDGEEKCLELKEHFSNEFKNLSKADKEHVFDFVDSVAG